MDWFWNWGGECFGCRDGESLFTYFGNEAGSGAPCSTCPVLAPDFPRCYVKDPFGLIYNLTN
jgi:hypothetical protein